MKRLQTTLVRGYFGRARAWDRDDIWARSDRLGLYACSCSVSKKHEKIYLSLNFGFEEKQSR